jgi:CheY-like chemotaxis protein
MDLRQKFCILVVDDDRVFGKLCVDAFRAAGYRVDTAENGGVALEKLKLTSYDVVVSDVEMPVLDGLSLFRKCMERYAQLKNRFIFMTGSMSKPVISTISRLDVEFMQKPFKLSDLVEKVDAVTSAIVSDSGGGFRKERRSDRMPHTEDCFVTETVLNIPVYSQTVDLSEHGVRISYIGRPFVLGSPLKLFITRLGISATGSIIWSRPLDGLRSVSGIEFTRPMSGSKVLSISNA